MQNKITIPLSLIDILYTVFKNKDFTFFSVMTFAKSYEVEEWKEALNFLLKDNAFIITKTGNLSNRYKFNDNHPFIKRFII
ncbi:Uncharacterised protein [Yersinia enterocolitica]|uniref:Uncharacterized protein n=1 Tax=Proteus terrae subsp. cibarius TaxID=626774 RepID=A0ABX6JSY9_9GAMM|nr:MULTISPECIES: hypothetical protein [Enterobacterales]MBU5964327.1 hypothetical protein [Proteus mirabilis]QGW05278.1 hypothetical protein F9282_19975 [Proteus terrae subsp. cibarius]QHD96449.1 hypothetical protein GSM99_18800 [Proteus terrae subsp. cibarius]QIF92310.1 hypothetical protein GTH23_19905 [Proteus terrae subsp. cibarius]QJW53119.1 hypothetical protein HND96_19710 [Proteus terrae subsp. cibarius]